MYSHNTLKEPRMSRLIRKQIYIEPEQDAVLKRRARELGVSESELMRLGIAQVAPVSAEAEGRLHAWQHIMAFVATYDQVDVPQTGRNWTRDELYDERFQRRSG
jgi:hypothetical protein